MKLKTKILLEYLFETFMCWQFLILIFLGIITYFIGESSINNTMKVVIIMEVVIALILSLKNWDEHTDKIGNKAREKLEKLKGGQG
jgi:hypothetical protein